MYSENTSSGLNGLLYRDVITFGDKEDNDDFVEKNEKKPERIYDPVLYTFGCTTHEPPLFK